MNFEQSIYSLSEFLIDNNFSVAHKEQHFIRYTTNSAVITVAYANLEYIFYIHVGQDSKSMVELTPNVVKEVFSDDSFQFKSTLTIDNLISFLKTTGKLIVSGDKEVFKRLNEFYERKSNKFTRQIIHSINIKGADSAWKRKNYMDFIECIDRIEKELLPESYLKKYKIAVDKLLRQTE